MFGESIAFVVLLMLVVYAIACFVIYHKIFRVYYFGSIRSGIMGEIVTCVIIASILTGITVYFWYATAAILIFVTLVLRKKISEPLTKTAVTVGMSIFIVFVVIAGIVSKNNMKQEETVDNSYESVDDEKQDSNEEKMEDIREKNSLEDYYGSYLSIDGYVSVEINPISSRLTEIVLTDIGSGTIDYTLTAAFVRDGDDYYLRASNSTQVLIIRKDYIEFDEYEGEGIRISGCEIKTYNNLYIDETVAEAQQVGKSEYTNTADLSSYLGALYSIYGGDVIIELYMDADGNLCVMEGNPVTEYVSYSQTYDSYMIKDDTLYGYVGELADEFVFEEDGIVDGEVEVLLAVAGSNHYQTYIQEEEYFNTNWREAFGMEQ